jgi:GH35 family endo-1,4-beta-xylanase
MKRTLLIFLLLNLILSACTPAPTPIPTPTPSATPLPTATTAPTNTAIPTATPTPIPTIQVGSLSIPDPRVTNPELFNLTKPDAPIPQFVNAMKNGGIDVSAEQIAQGITYVSTKADGAPLIDKDCNPFVVAVYNLDPSLFPEQYRDLSGRLPLFYYNASTKQWIFETTTKKLSKINNFPLGVLLMPDVPESIELTKNNFSIGVATYNILKITNNNVNTPPEKYNFSWPDFQVTLAQQLGLKVRFHILMNRDDMPQGLENFTREEFINFLESYFTGVFSHFEKKFPGIVVEYDILGESRPNETDRDFYAAKFGQEYPRLVFETAYRIKNQINPNIRIGYIDTNNLLPTSSATGVNKDLILPQINRYIDYYGVEAHLNLDSDKLNNPKDLENAVNNLNDYRRITGKPILITENDIKNKSPLEQAYSLYLLLQACDKTSVESLTFWGIGDNNSWLGNEAEATPFDSNFNPKLAWYILGKFLLEKASK